MANFLPPAKVGAIRRSFAVGLGIRATARALGIASGTVARYYGMGPEQACPCGRPLEHQGWCAFRLERSPKRRAVLERLHERQRGDGVSGRAFDPRSAWPSEVLVELAPLLGRVEGAAQELDAAMADLDDFLLRLGPLHRPTVTMIDAFLKTHAFDRLMDPGVIKRHGAGLSSAPPGATASVTPGRPEPDAAVSPPIAGAATEEPPVEVAATISAAAAGPPPPDLVQAPPRIDPLRCEEEAEDAPTDEPVDNAPPQPDAEAGPECLPEPVDSGASQQDPTATLESQRPDEPRDTEPGESDGRRCVQCDELLVRRKGESRQAYERRKSCDAKCGARHTASIRKAAGGYTHGKHRAEPEALPASEPAAAEASPETKVCAECEETFTRKPGDTDEKWARREFCGYGSAGRANVRQRADRKPAAPEPPRRTATKRIPLHHPWAIGDEPQPMPLADAVRVLRDRGHEVAEPRHPDSPYVVGSMKVSPTAVIAMARRLVEEAAEPAREMANA